MGVGAENATPGGLEKGRPCREKLRTYRISFWLLTFRLTNLLFGYLPQYSCVPAPDELGKWLPMKGCNPCFIHVHVLTCCAVCVVALEGVLSANAPHLGDVCVAFSNGARINVWRGTSGS